MGKNINVKGIRSNKEVRICAFENTALIALKHVFEYVVHQMKKRYKDLFIRYFSKMIRISI